MKPALPLAISFFSLLLFSGCVMGRRTVPLDVPSSAASTTPSKGEFTIASAIDDRRFENKPASPSTPSVDGDVHALSKAELARMIGRQRNTYGKAMGDIALPGTNSVPDLASALVAEGLRRSGYSIATEGAAANTAEVRVEQFWAWFSPGMWSVGFEAHVQCQLNLTINGRTIPMTVRGAAENRGQVASDANWKLAYSRAFDDFLGNFQHQLQAAGL